VVGEAQLRAQVRSEVQRLCEKSFHEDVF
jgi:hypothetical protein